MASRGTAGKTFQDARLQSKFGSKNVAAGATGERALDAMLNKAFPNYTIWRSLRTPAAPGQKRYTSDIDFAIANGTRLILIDAKMWKANRTYWTFPFTHMPFAGFAPMRHDNQGWKPLGSNMAMALDRTRQMLSTDINTSAMVVFVPSKKQNGLPNSVSLLKWPGGIKSYLPDAALGVIQRKLGKPEPVAREIQRLLDSLVQR